MTILQFPMPSIAPPDPRRAALMQLASELGAIVLFPDVAPQQPTLLTPRESEAWGRLDWRTPKTPQQIAEALMVTRDRAKQILSSLKGKGYACRIGHYHFGGWLKCQPSLERAA